MNLVSMTIIIRFMKSLYLSWIEPWTIEFQIFGGEILMNTLATRWKNGETLNHADNFLKKIKSCIT